MKGEAMNDEFKRYLFEGARARLISKILELANTGKGLGVMQDMEATIDKLPVSLTIFYPYQDRKGAFKNERR